MKLALIIFMAVVFVSTMVLAYLLWRHSFKLEKSALEAKRRREETLKQQGIENHLDDVREDEEESKWFKGFI